MVDVGADVWVRVTGEEVWSKGRVIAVTAKDVEIDLAIGDNGHPTGKTGSVIVPTATERESAELSNVKLRNNDWFRFNTSGRGGVDDLIQLTHLHEPAILDVLQTRFKNDTIYTSTGPILLAVNPFQRLPLYGRQTLEEYYSTGILRAQGVDAPPLPPHVFQVADTAFRRMMAGATAAAAEASGGGSGNAPVAAPRNQSMLVSGESGAGKTETTKFMMQYLATVGRPKNNSAANAVIAVSHNLSSLASPEGAPTVEKRVLDSNPILEAFGNAKTLRNENSSRFGKFIQLQFNTKGELVGAKIETYLLEKVRLVTQSKGERNYHIFYQVLAGATPEQAASWVVEAGPTGFNFTNQSGCTTLRDCSDKDEYNITRSAMSTMGITNENQEGLLAALAGILHLSNCTFDGGASPTHAAGGKGGSGGGAGARRPSTSNASGSDTCTFSASCKTSATAAARLLGVEYAELQNVLSGKEITAGSEKYRVHFSAAQCAASVEALAKALYSKLFNWVVWAINRQIRADEAIVNSFIGVLDIFGFESFQTNSFEQLCINYCNETLQQHFNQFVFKLEQEEYIKEQIDWSNVEFPDNQDCLDLIELKRPAGILSTLDEQCLLQTGSDEGFARKCYDSLKDHKRFSATAKQKVNLEFVIRHYAGDVIYSCPGFVEKNKDQIHREATELLAASAAPMVRTFFTPETWASSAPTSSAAAPAAAGAGGAVDDAGVDVDALVAAAAAATGSGGSTGAGASAVKPPPGKPGVGKIGAGASSASSASSSGAGKFGAGAAAASGAGAGSGGKKGGGLMSDTVGTQFRGQLASLLTIVRSTAPHYVRCLKPNPRQVPREFNRAELVHQLRCNGVLEAVRVARLGYPVRAPHSEILRTYRFLAKLEISRQANELAKKGDMRAAAKAVMLSLGLPAGQVQVGLTKVFFRRAAFDEVEAQRQKALRGAAVRIQSAVRCHQAKKRYAKMRKSIIVVQSLIRAWKARKVVRSIRQNNAAIVVQSFARMAIAARRYQKYRNAVIRMQSWKRGNTDRKRVLAMRKEIGACKLQSTYRMHVLRRRFLRARKAVTAIQCALRVRRAKALLDRYKREAKDIANLKQNAEALKVENKHLLEEVALWKCIVAEISNGKVQSVESGVAAIVELIRMELGASAADAAAAGASARAAAAAAAASLAIGGAGAVPSMSAAAPVPVAAAPPTVPEAATAAAVDSAAAHRETAAPADAGVVPSTTSPSSSLQLAAASTASGASDGRPVVSVDGAVVETGPSVVAARAAVSSSDSAAAPRPVAAVAPSSPTPASTPAMAASASPSAHASAAASSAMSFADGAFSPSATAAASGSNNDALVAQLRAKLAEAERRAVAAEMRVLMLREAAAEAAQSQPHRHRTSAASDGPRPIPSPSGAASDGIRSRSGTGEDHDVTDTSAGAEVNTSGASAGEGAGAAALVSTDSILGGEDQPLADGEVSIRDVVLHTRSTSGDGAAGGGAGSHHHGHLSSSGSFSSASSSAMAGLAALAAMPGSGISLDMVEFAQRRQEKLESEIQRLKREVESYKKRLTKAEESAASASAAKLKSEEKVVLLAKDKDMLTRSLDQIQNETLKDYQTKFEDLASQLSNAKQVVNSRSKDFDTAKSELERFKRDLEGKVASLAERDDEVTALKEKAVMDGDVKMALAQRLDAAIVERAELSDLNRKLKTQLDSAEAARASQVKQIQILSQALAGTTAEVKRLQLKLGKASPMSPAGPTGAPGAGFSATAGGAGNDAVPLSPSPAMGISASGMRALGLERDTSMGSARSGGSAGAPAAAATGGAATPGAGLAVPPTSSYLSRPGLTSAYSFTSASAAKPGGFGSASSAGGVAGGSAGSASASAAAAAGSAHGGTAAPAPASSMARYTSYQSLVGTHPSTGVAGGAGTSSPGATVSSSSALASSGGVAGVASRFGGSSLSSSVLRPSGSPLGAYGSGVTSSLSAGTASIAGIGSRPAGISPVRAMLPAGATAGFGSTTGLPPSSTPMPSAGPSTSSASSSSGAAAHVVPPAKPAGSSTSAPFSKYLPFGGGHGAST